MDLSFLLLSDSISNLVGYSIPKPSFKKNNNSNPQLWRYGGSYLSEEYLSKRENLEFELTFYDVKVPYVSHNATWTQPEIDR